MYIYKYSETSTQTSSNWRGKIFFSQLWLSSVTNFNLQEWFSK